jgi:hypothetical protein
VARAVDALEGDPSSKDHAGALEQKIADVRATEDPEVMKALAKLVASLERAGIGGSAITQVNLSVQGGNLQGVIGAQQVTIATLSTGSRWGELGFFYHGPRTSGYQSHASFTRGQTSA